MSTIDRRIAKLEAVKPAREDNLNVVFLNDRQPAPTPQRYDRRTLFVRFAPPLDAA